MMKQASYTVEISADEISDLDLTPKGGWIAISASQHLLFGERRVPIPEPIPWYPMVRALGEDVALVVDRRAGDEPNAWIINSSGDIIRNFYAGDAVQDVLASERFIVVSYFDESAVCGVGLEGNGVAVFSSAGTYEFGYRELFGEEAVDIVDCYCTCWVDDRRILFLPYTDFPLVLWDLERKTQEIWETPPELAGSNAIAANDSLISFHSPYHDEDGIWQWEIGQPDATKVGEYKGNLRGLRNGKFFGLTQSGYAIISDG